MNYYYFYLENTKEKIKAYRKLLDYFLISHLRMTKE